MFGNYIAQINNDLLQRYLQSSNLNNTLNNKVGLNNIQKLMLTINDNGTITTNEINGKITNFNVSGTFLSKNLYKYEYTQIAIMIGKTVEL